MRLLQKLDSKNMGPLSASERDDAFHRWMKTSQVFHYDEIGNLTSRISARLPLVRQLRLFLDSNGLLRCGRRIHDAPLDHSAKFPFMIPPTYPITNLIISDPHAKQLHSGVNATIAALRQSYWITYEPTWKETTGILHDLPKTRRDSLQGPRPSSPTEGESSRNTSLRRDWRRFCWTPLCKRRPGSHQIPTLVRVFLCPCVGPIPSLGLTLTWSIWVEN